jgi:hypothetical protein
VGGACHPPPPPKAPHPEEQEAKLA